MHEITEISIRDAYADVGGGEGGRGVVALIFSRHGGRQVTAGPSSGAEIASYQARDSGGINTGVGG